jgi:hypothetical protein
MFLLYDYKSIQTDLKRLKTALGCLSISHDIRSPQPFNSVDAGD